MYSFNPCKINLARFRAAKLRLLNFLSLFRDLQKPTRQWGGGSRKEFFRDLQEPTRFSVGGGVVAEFFRDLQEPKSFSGGGVVAGFFRDLQLRNQIFTQH